MHVGDEKSIKTRSPGPIRVINGGEKKFSFPHLSFFSFTNGGSISATIYLLPSLLAYINTSFRRFHLPEKKGASITLSPPKKKPPPMIMSETNVTSM